MYALDLKEDVLGCLHRQVCTADLRLGRQSLALDILRHHHHRIWCEQALPTRGTATHGARESRPREPDGWCPSGSNRAQPTPPWLPLTVRAYVGALREQRLCICAPPAQAVPNFALTQPPRLSHPRNRFQRLNDAIRRNDPNGWLLDNYAEALRAIKAQGVPDGKRLRPCPPESEPTGSQPFGRRRPGGGLRARPTTARAPRTTVAAVRRRLRGTFLTSRRTPGASISPPRHVRDPTSDASRFIPISTPRQRCRSARRTRPPPDPTKPPGVGNWNVRRGPATGGAGRQLPLLHKEAQTSGAAVRTASRYWSFLLKLYPDRPSPTIQGQPGPWVGPFGWESRRPRVAELDRLMTLPDDYVACGTHRPAASAP